MGQATEAPSAAQAVGTGGALKLVLDYTGFTCRKCKVEAEVEEGTGGRLVKGWVAQGRARTSLLCPDCNTCTVKMDYTGLMVPAITGDELKAFWAKAKTLDVTGLKKFVNEYTRTEHSVGTRTSNGGPYLPMSVHEVDGWSADWILRNYNDCYDKDGLTFYQLRILTVEDTEGDTRTEGRIAEASGAARAKAAPRGGKTAVPKLEGAEVGSWTDKQHTVFLAFHRPVLEQHVTDAQTMAEDQAFSTQFPPLMVESLKKLLETWTALAAAFEGTAVSQELRLYIVFQSAMVLECLHALRIATCRARVSRLHVYDTYIYK